MMDGEVLSDEENHNIEMDFDMENEDSNHGVFPDDEAIEVPAGDPSKGKPIKPKKVIRNPQPKLDALRLMGPRGIGILPNTFKSYKFKGKGYEKEDLNLLMKQLEHWSHRLFPKLTFDDMLKQLEKLGYKKQVQTLIKKMRMDLLQSDELVVDNPDEPDAIEVQTEDVFDKLLPTTEVVNQDAEFIFSTAAQSQPQPRAISAEDRERMERNKKLAMERRKSKLLEKEDRSISASQPFVSQTDSVISSTNMVPALRDDYFDEDMLKAFEDEGTLDDPSLSSNIRSSTQDNAVLLAENYVSEDTPPIYDSKSNVEGLLDSQELECIAKVPQIDFCSVAVNNIPSTDICTEDDILDNL